MGETFVGCQPFPTDCAQTNASRLLVLRYGGQERMTYAFSCIRFDGGTSTTLYLADLDGGCSVLDTAPGITHVAATHPDLLEADNSRVVYAKATAQGFVPPTLIVSRDVKTGLSTSFDSGIGTAIQTVAMNTNPDRVVWTEVSSAFGLAFPTHMNEYSFGQNAVVSRLPVPPFSSVVFSASARHYFLDAYNKELRRIFRDGGDANDGGPWETMLDGYVFTPGAMAFRGANQDTVDTVYWNGPVEGGTLPRLRSASLTSGLHPTVTGRATTVADIDSLVVDRTSGAVAYLVMANNTADSGQPQGLWKVGLLDGGSLNKLDARNFGNVAIVGSRLATVDNDCRGVVLRPLP